LQLEHSFTVPVGINEAWNVLLDIERIAPCMPGAAIDSVDGDDFTGTVKVKLGPIGLTYKGKASFVEKDEAAHKAVIRAQGRDSRGNGTAAATVTAVLAEQSGATKVDVTTDLDITGKPAQFGRGVMVDVGNKLIGQFADCLATQLAGGGASAESPTDELPSASDAPTEELPTAPAAAAAPAKKAPAKKAPARKAPAKKVAAASSGATATASVNGADAASESAAVQPSAVEASSEPAAEPVAEAVAQAAPQPTPAYRSAPRDVEPIDLMQSAGPAVAKRLAPVLGGLLLLLIILRVLRRR
jgi:carbon monoxide dehydrogenase subunit G